MTWVNPLRFQTNRSGRHRRQQGSFAPNQGRWSGHRYRYADLFRSVSADVSMLQRFVSFILTFALLTVLMPPYAPAAEPQLRVHLFWQHGCPYCEGAKADLRAIVSDKPGIRIESHELGTDARTEQIYEAALSHFGYRQAAVPLVIIGERSFLGYFEGGHSAKQYGDAVNKCLQVSCRDILAGFKEATPKTDLSKRPKDLNEAENLVPTTIEVPLVGPVQLADLSLLALTVLLAAIDGFNPCAMWVVGVSHRTSSGSGE